MGRKDFKIPDKKYNDAVNLIINGERTIQAIADEVGIDWKTAKRIYTDPDTHELIAQNASDKFKNSMDAMADIMLDIAKSSKIDGVRLEAAKNALALAGMVPTTKQEINHSTPAGKLDDLFDQLQQRNTSMINATHPQSQAPPSGKEADDA